MLNSIYFLLTLIVVLMLLVWSLKNDKAASIKDQFGLFAMRIPDGNSRGDSSKKQPYVPGQDTAVRGAPVDEPHTEPHTEPQA
jgi:hypothetical protein